MLIGIPKEIKPQEQRVGLVPGSVRELIDQGHKVIVESTAGDGIGCHDEDYKKAGADIRPSADAVFAEADMIVKVKEPQPIECEKLRPGQILFTYLHLAPDPQQAEGLIASRCSAIAYETVTSNRGGLPLLQPMSEVAGRLSIQAGAHCLEQNQGGRGILLGGVPGVAPANVVVIGGGVVGSNALRMAIGMGAQVTVLDRSLPRLEALNAQFGSRLKTIYSTHQSVESYVLDADLVIGAVLIPGASAPKVVNKDMLSKMREGAVLVDVAIDQGGAFETSRPTTHQAPTYTIDGIVHYCVANMPAGVPRTSAFALNNATLPFVLALANKGLRQALADDVHLCNGLNVHYGLITHDSVARDLKQEYVPPLVALG